MDDSSQKPGSGGLTPTLQVKDLHVAYGSHIALAGVRFEVAKGLVGLLGVNGAGKTSLMQAISGLKQPQSGTVRIVGADPYNPREKRSALQHCALVPQHFDFPRHFTLRDFLRYMAGLRDVSVEDAPERIQESATAVNLQDVLAVKLRKLSGGMLRRANIAQALLGRPDLLLLDESTVGLDPEQRAHVRDIIQAIADQRTVLFASHIVEDIAETSRRVVILNNASVAYDGSVAGLIASRGGGDGPTSLERAFLSLIHSQEHS